MYRKSEIMYFFINCKINTRRSVSNSTQVEIILVFQQNAVAICSVESWVNDVKDRKAYLPSELLGKEVEFWIYLKS